MAEASPPTNAVTVPTSSRAVRAWGLEILCANPAEYSSALTAVMMPAGHDADALRVVTTATVTAKAKTGPRKVCVRVVDVFGFEAEVVTTVVAA